MSWHHQERRRRRDARRELRDELRSGGEEVAQWALDQARDKLKKHKKPISPEERALKEARAAVGRRLGFFGHLIPYVIVNFGILITGGFRAALTVATFWGIGLACHALLRADRAGSAQAVDRNRIAPPHARGGLAQPPRARRPPRAQPGTPLGVDRPRDPQSDHCGEESAPADGRGSALARERRVRARRAAGAGARRALDLAPAPLRARRGTAPEGDRLRRDRALGTRDAARTHRPLRRRRCASTSTRPACWSAIPRSCAAS